jgi:hypothetical protein
VLQRIRSLQRKVISCNAIEPPDRATP